MSPRNRVMLGLMLASTIGHVARADVSSSIEPGMRYVRMSEYNQDRVRTILESGWLPGMGGDLRYRSDKLEAFGSAQAFQSNLSYDGRLQNGALFDTKTATRMVRLQAGIRYALADASRVVLALEHDSWRRDIRGRGSVLGLLERSSSWRTVLGVERDWTAPGCSSATAGLSLVLAQPERLTVRFPNGLDDATLRTRSASGLRLHAGFQPAAMPRLSLGAELDWIKIGRSDTQAVTRGGAAAGQVTQPEHVRGGLSLFARYRFQ